MKKSEPIDVVTRMIILIYTILCVVSCASKEKTETLDVSSHKTEEITLDVLRESKLQEIKTDKETEQLIIFKNEQYNSNFTFSANRIITRDTSGNTTIVENPKWIKNANSSEDIEILRNNSETSESKINETTTEESNVVSNSEVITNLRKKSNSESKPNSLNFIWWLVPLIIVLLVFIFYPTKILNWILVVFNFIKNKINGN